MGRKRNRKPLLENIEIVKLAAEGKAIAKVDDKVVFVTNVIPGDVVDVQVTKKRKSYMEGHPVVFHKYSDLRVDAFVSILVSAEDASGKTYHTRNN